MGHLSELRKGAHDVKNETRKQLISWILFVIMLALGFTMILPFIWTLSSSFKFKREIMGFPIDWIPANPTVNNYVKLWSNYPFLTYYLNTIKVTLIVLVVQITVSSMAGRSDTWVMAWKM